MRRRALTLIAASSIAACAPGRTPQTALEAYRGAIAAGDEQAAFLLLAEEARASSGRARSDLAVQRRVSAGPTYLAQLDDAAQQAGQIDATLTYGTYDSVTLRRQGQGWRIVAGVADVDAQFTARQALRTLIRALKIQDASLMLRLAPSDYRAQMSPEDVQAWFEGSAESIALFLDRVGALGRLEPVVRGDVATLRYGSRVVELRREGQRWVVWDFE